MKGIGVRVAVAAALAVAATAALGWARWAGSKLYYDGKVVSTKVIVHDGEAYAPVRDIAAALSLAVQARGDGYALVHPGGGMQVEGMTGKIGDDLFNGMLRLKVIQVIRGDHYKRRFSQGDELVAKDGDDIVAVVIRLKNGTQKSLGLNVLGNPSALTDEDAHSYEPFSGGYADNPGIHELLPGAAVDFALTFQAPKSAVLKDLVYTADTLPIKRGQVFRISLKEPQKESQ